MFVRWHLFCLRGKEQTWIRREKCGIMDCCEQLHQSCVMLTVTDDSLVCFLFFILLLYCTCVVCLHVCLVCWCSQTAVLSPLIKGTPSVTVMCIDFGWKCPSDWRLKCLIPLCTRAKLCFGNQFQLGLWAMGSPICFTLTFFILSF